MRVSVIIKTLNEERNIERAIVSSLQAVQTAGGGEVIVADSLSSDGTVAVAARFPVRVVQLQAPEDRCCGVGAQLGFSVAQGEYLYILDGDMEFEPGFLAQACQALDADGRLAGVGGLVREMNLANEEFVHRAQRGLRHMRPGPVDRLDMGGLYRAQALRNVGYFTNQNLHAYEEFELAARLATAGWRLLRLDVPGVRHYGHTDSSFRLLLRRWKSRYAWGCGELLRAAWGQPHLRFTVTRLQVFRVYGGVLAWALTVLALFIAALFSASAALLGAAVMVAALPVLLMAWRRRSLGSGLYAVAAWLVFAAGLVVGALSPPRRRPTDAVPFRQLQ